MDVERLSELKLNSYDIKEAIYRRSPPFIFYFSLFLPWIYFELPGKLL